MNFNKVVLVGRLTQDPQSRFTSAGTAVATFTLAVNREWDSENADFIRVSAFGGLADIATKYLNKGKLVLVEGSIKTRSWEDQNGRRHFVTEVVAEKIRMLERRESKQNASDTLVDEPWENETTGAADPDEPPF